MWDIVLRYLKDGCGEDLAALYVSADGVISVISCCNLKKFVERSASCGRPLHLYRSGSDVGDPYPGHSVGNCQRARR